MFDEIDQEAEKLDLLWYELQQQIIIEQILENEHIEL